MISQSSISTIFSEPYDTISLKSFEDGGLRQTV